MNLQLSEEANKILIYSHEEAARLGNYQLLPEHLLLGILRHNENKAVELMARFGVDPGALKTEMEHRLDTGTPIPPKESDKITMTGITKTIFDKSYLEAARRSNDKLPQAIDLLLSLLNNDNENNKVTKMLKTYRLDYRSALANYYAGQPAPPRPHADFEEDIEDTPEGNPAPEPAKTSPNTTVNSKPSSDTPVLDNYGVDLTAAAHEGKLDPVVGRDREIERLAQILPPEEK